MNSKDWKTSAQHLRDVRYLALMAAFIAMKIMLSSAYIPLSESLHIGISFTVVCIEASIIGPVSGMVSGFITDLLSFMIFPNGPFFPGYTLTAMLGELVYALFLYNRPITILRIAGAKVVNNYVVNVLIGCLWSNMIYGKGYIYYFMKSIVKNTLMLPVEIILLVLLFNLLGQTLKKRNLIHPETSFPIPVIARKK